MTSEFSKADIAHSRRIAFVPAAIALFYFGLLILSAGCSGGGNASASPQDHPSANASGGPSLEGAKSANSSSRTAEQILKDMEATYHRATSYADEGIVHLKFDRNGKSLSDDLDFSTAFVRPNKLRLICYGAMAVSDGKQFRASVKSVPNVVMQIPSPDTLKIDDLFHDPQLQTALVEGPAGPPVQALFLFGDNTLSQLLQDATQPPKLLSPDVIDGRKCNQVDIENSQGTLILWIDQQDNLIRRIQLPTREFKKSLEQDGPVNNVSLVVDLDKAGVNQPIDDKAFQFEIPEGAKVLDALVEEVRPAPIAPASDPTAFKLTKLWSSGDIKEPGNILIVENPTGDPTILAFDGWRTVVELDKTGKVTARHELEIPESTAVFRLRTCTDAHGKRYYAALADAQPQFHVFDENWNKLFSYPKPEDSANSGIGDVQIVDLEGKGKPQFCVGYWGDIGVQGVSLDGNREWRDRSLQFVLHLAASPPDASGKRKLLCMNNKGTIAPLNAEGKPEQEITIPNRFLQNLASADLTGKGQSEYCGLSTSSSGDNFAVGIALDGHELWNYPLPAGVTGLPIETITTGKLAADDTKQWIIAGADGSIHILAADGKPIDKFNSGSALSGLAATKLGNQRVLLVSKVLEKPEGNAKGVLEAWLVEPTAK